MPAHLYRKFFSNMGGGETSGEARQSDLLSDTIKVTLHTSSYTPNKDTHETFSDATNEVSGTGYSAGGVTLGSKTLAFTAANSWGTTWPTSTAVVAGYVVRPVSGNGFLYRCFVGGTTHSLEPTWPTTVGDSVTETGGVKWTNIGGGINVFDAADASWPASTITARYAVIWNDTPTDNPLLGYIDFSTDQSSSNGEFRVTWDAQGIIQVSVP